jgi:hypothetical protein
MQRDRLVSNKESFGKLVSRCDAANEVVGLLKVYEKSSKLTAFNNLNGSKLNKCHNYFLLKFKSSFQKEINAFIGLLRFHSTPFLQ